MLCHLAGSHGLAAAASPWLHSFWGPRLPGKGWGRANSPRLPPGVRDLAHWRCGGSWRWPPMHTSEFLPSHMEHFSDSFAKKTTNISTLTNFSDSFAKKQQTLALWQTFQIFFAKKRRTLAVLRSHGVVLQQKNKIVSDYCFFVQNNVPLEIFVAFRIKLQQLCISE